MKRSDHRDTAGLSVELVLGHRFRRGAQTRRTDGDRNLPTHLMRPLGTSVKKSPLSH